MNLVTLRGTGLEYKDDRRRDREDRDGRRRDDDYRRRDRGRRFWQTLKLEEVISFYISDRDRTPRTERGSERGSERRNRDWERETPSSRRRDEDEDEKRLITPFLKGSQTPSPWEEDEDGPTPKKVGSWDQLTPSIDGRDR